MTRSLFDYAADKLSESLPGLQVKAAPGAPGCLARQAAVKAARTDQLRCEVAMRPAPANWRGPR